MKRKLFFAIISILGMLAISGCNNPKTYIVTFDANGGVGTMAPQTFTEGEAQALTRNSFTNGDYTFVGWNTFDSGIGINYSDEQIITAVEDMTLYAQWDLLVPEKGELNGHEWVDLGLPSGTKWATCNVGASNPEEYGDYYAWGEIYTKDAYVRNTYKYLDTSVNGGRITKYSGTDSLTTLEVADDAATANWGTGWYMPTKIEMQELYDNCTHTWTTQNDVNGCLFTGPNGNSIFLPAAGYRSSHDIDADTNGYYWSSSLNQYISNSIYLRFNSDYCYIYIIARCYGLSVRAVCR